MSAEAPRAGAEAARLVAAAQDWLRTAAPHLAPVDGDGATCPCPVCRGIAALREVDPDNVGRWVDGAVSALEGALGEVGARVAPQAPHPGEPPGAAPDEAARHDEPGTHSSTAPGPRRVRRVPLDDPAPAPPQEPSQTGIRPTVSEDEPCP